MKNSHHFFSNRSCKYFPCHTGLDPEAYNCMFCFCPLYSLGDTCGGVYKYSGDKGVKNCIDCLFPHMPENYETIMDKLKEVVEKVSRPDKVSEEFNDRT